MIGPCDPGNSVLTFVAPRDVPVPGDMDEDLHDGARVGAIGVRRAADGGEQRAAVSVGLSPAAAKP
eukprot:5652185-Lingulodinium_polyedra.AAC.1